MGPQWCRCCSTCDDVVDVGAEGGHQPLAHPVHPVEGCPGHVVGGTGGPVVGQGVEPIDVVGDPDGVPVGGQPGRIGERAEGAPRPEVGGDPDDRHVARPVVVQEPAVGPRHHDLAVPGQWHDPGGLVEQGGLPLHPGVDPLGLLEPGRLGALAVLVGLARSEVPVVG